MTNHRLTYDEIAERTGYTPGTIRTYRWGDPTFPDPAGRVGREPVWDPDDIDRWKANREGTDDD